MLFAIFHFFAVLLIDDKAFRTYFCQRCFRIHTLAFSSAHWCWHAAFCLRFLFFAFCIFLFFFDILSAIILLLALFLLFPDYLCFYFSAAYFHFHFQDIMLTDFHRHLHHPLCSSSFPIFLISSLPSAAAFFKIFHAFYDDDDTFIPFFLPLLLLHFHAFLPAALLHFLLPDISDLLL